MSKIPNVMKLRIKYCKKEKDFMVYYPRSSDGHFIHSAFLSKRIIQSIYSYDDDKSYEFMEYNGHRKLYLWDVFHDLKDRGYDLTTFKMEITISKDGLQSKFNHLWDDLSEKEKESVVKMGFLPPLDNTTKDD